MHSGFSTSSFAVEREVRQGDHLSAHLFIIVLEIVCISIRNSTDIRGIKVDNEEIELSLFADDMTAFLTNNLSVKNFLKLIDEYGNCSGLKINHDKSEILLLGNHGYTVQEDKSVPGNLKIKKSAKILGIHFSYASQLKQKLNVDELMNYIKQKLRIWRWRDILVTNILLYKINVVQSQACSLCGEIDESLGHFLCLAITQRISGLRSSNGLKILR